MKILAISQFFTPDITAAAFRISETVNHLRSWNNEVEVITTFPHKSESSEGVPASTDGIHRVRLPETENKGFVGYIYLYLSFMVKSIMKGYAVGRILKPDVIWASSPPIFVGLAGWLLAKILRAEFALDVRDIWPDSAVAAGQISDSGLAYKAGRWMEVFLYQHADMITCVAQPMREYIQEHTECEVKVIYNGVEVAASGSDMEQDEQFNLKTVEKSDDVTTVLYAGNFGHVQQLDLLVKAFKDIDHSRLKKNWEVFFLGGGAKKEYLQDLVESYELNNCIQFLDPVPKEEVFSYLKSADVLFIHLQDSEVLRLTIPSKVFDYMLADRPLLAGIHGEGKNIIESVAGNVTFNSGDKQSLINGIKKLDQKISLNGKTNNASIVREAFSRRKQSEKLNTLLNNLVTG